MAKIKIILRKLTEYLVSDLHKVKTKGLIKGVRGRFRAQIKIRKDIKVEVLEFIKIKMLY